jgi:succinate dehydrogenase hydrophobic anchor subunit
MAKPHSVDQEMDLIMSNPPSASRNSNIVLTFRILTLLAGLVSIIIGLSLIISSTIQSEIVDLILVSPENTQEPIIKKLTYQGSIHIAQIKRVTAVFGVGLILAGLLLLTISRLSKTIRNRNIFIYNACMRWEELR